MGQFQDKIDRLTAEVAKTRGLEESAIKLIKGFPEIVRAAVAAALAQNPTADLSMLDSLADDLDAANASFEAALQADPTSGAETGTADTSATPVAE